jgi:hypothetical protein
VLTKRISLAAALAAAVGLFGVTPALAAKPKPAKHVAAEPTEADPYVVWLDSHDSDDGHYAGPAMGPRLTDGKIYVATVQGSLSYYAASMWKHPEKPFDAICGETDELPTFPSPHVKDGDVGMDAEMIFGRPCSGPDGDKSPGLGHWTNFEINTNTVFRYIRAIGSPFATYSPSHTYEYPLFGHGAAVQFRLRDLPGTADNYGRLRISVALADTGECNGDEYQDFGFATWDECENALYYNANPQSAN